MLCTYYCLASPYDFLVPDIHLMRLTLKDLQLACGYESADNHQTDDYGEANEKTNTNPERAHAASVLCFRHNKSFPRSNGDCGASRVTTITVIKSSFQRENSLVVYLYTGQNVKYRPSTCCKTPLRLWWCALLLSAVIAFAPGCRAPDRSSEQSSSHFPDSSASSPLTMLSLSQASPAKYEKRTLKEFGLRRRVPVRYLPSNGDSIDSEPKLYQQILRHRDSQPDILMIDTIWPAILAEDLIDLKPYLPEAVAAAAPIEIRNNTVDGRVVAIPLLFSVGVLYYRPSLLQHYGFHHPPETWDELENMSRVIQQGERRAGNRDFWGYVWTGGSDEGLTCVALEWFLSQGGTNFVEEGGVAHLNNPQNV